MNKFCGFLVLILLSVTSSAFAGIVWITNNTAREQKIKILWYGACKDTLYVSVPVGAKNHKEERAFCSVQDVFVEGTNYKFHTVNDMISKYELVLTQVGKNVQASFNQVHLPSTWGTGA